MLKVCNAKYVKVQNREKRKVGEAVLLNVEKYESPISNLTIDSTMSI